MQGLLRGRTRDFVARFKAAALAVCIAASVAIIAGPVFGQAPPRSPIPDLKQAPAAVRVVGITHCDREAIFRLKMADGKVRPYPEIGLRLKIDSTDNGPPPGLAVLIPAGMVGDRASLVFRNFADMRALVVDAC